ncbi:bacterial alpha-L-rhamnosidase-domain-containing protein [Chaetomidium leptoderma]|uniref:Bacterial alpha-L-rhamnosidase-domain-containing protein n=1 Tax=Chaetomidium leptoderma TaxID=669021 RepID=A0AAN6VP57_9PEZI|nr:bacterial alpha-L-rhamnosidase-domain-containing protein [Chaetomidium leptoderma]
MESGTTSFTAGGQQSRSQRLCTRLAEIYDGEKYDATLEVPFWSSTEPHATTTPPSSAWEPAISLSPLPTSVELVAGFGEPVWRVETVQPVQKILKRLLGPRDHKVTLSHAEVLEGGELGTRPLRHCKATDEYTLKGAAEGEHYEPRFTFHGFRYAQIDGWPGDLDLVSIEAVVRHTDMKSAGSFECSDRLLNRLYQNVSVLVYDCFNMLKNWLIDLEHDQGVLDGVPPMVSPNATLPDPVWRPGILSILAQQYNSMMTWMRVLPRNKSGATHPWDTSVFQLGDWLDPAKFLHERVAGLCRLEPGWTRCRVAPAVGAEFTTSASASYVTPRGTVSCAWHTRAVAGGGGGGDGMEVMQLDVSVPYGTMVEVVNAADGDG